MKAYKFKMKPSRRIASAFAQWLDVCQELYNAALAERRDAYRLSGISINYSAQSAQLPEIKSIRADVGLVYAQVLQDVLRRVERTYAAFFRRIKDGDKPGYPRFKSKARYDSFTYPRQGFKLAGNKLSLSKIGNCLVRLSRPIEGKVKTCTIKREGDGWYVIFVCETELQPLPATGNIKAIDVGLEYFITDQHGEVVQPPEFYRASEYKLQKAQRQLSKKQKGSGHWRRAKARVAKVHSHVANQRKDFLHKLSTQIIRENDIIFFELLNIAGMAKNCHLAKSISDAAWGTFIIMLSYKAEWAGRMALNINPKGTSQLCSRCGERVPKGLSTRWHRCPHCELEIQRDHNAALNILARGMALLAVGQTVTAPGGLALAGPANGEPALRCKALPGALLLPHS